MLKRVQKSVQNLISGHKRRGGSTDNSENTADRKQPRISPADGARSTGMGTAGGRKQTKRRVSPADRAEDTTEGIAGGGSVNSGSAAGTAGGRGPIRRPIITWTY